MYNVKDNIVALATTPGRSAINVIRLSGPDSKKIIKQFFLDPKKSLKPNYCFVVDLFSPKTNVFLDQAMVVFFQGPKSFTGEDVIEVSTHGGLVVCKKVLDAFLGLGCRFAHEGEFSYRAFINGKIDLIQAEAIAGIIDSNSELSVSFSLENLSGALSKKITSLCGALKEIIVYMEHELDFNEEEIDFVGFDKYIKKINDIKKESEDVLNCSFLFNQKTSDLTVSILGLPNVGKSSLFNALLGQNRSIVTNVSGTTRDLVDAHLTVEGLRVCLVDTAGIRKTSNIAEKEGVLRAEKKIKDSDLVLLVDDKDPTIMRKKLNVGKNVFLIQNKIDLNSFTKKPGVFYLSCKNGDGVSNLFTHLSTYIKNHRELFIEKNSFIVSERVSFLLNSFIKNLNQTIHLLKESSDLPIIASSLYNAYDLFVQSVNPVNKEDIINNIFKGFCVGK